MKNKKLALFNIVILLLFIAVVFIGKQTWGEQALAESDGKKEERVPREMPKVKDNPLLLEPSLIKKTEVDLAPFFVEELEIVELEDGEEEDEPSVEELVDKREEQIVNDPHRYTDVSTEKEKSFRESSIKTEKKLAKKETKPEEKKEKNKPKNDQIKEERPKNPVKEKPKKPVEEPDEVIEPSEPVEEGEEKPNTPSEGKPENGEQKGEG